MKKAIWIVLIAIIVLAPTFASAADGSWKLRGRVINVNPNDSSDAIAASGTKVAVDAATTIEVDATYMFNESWGLEVIAALPSHDLTGSGGAFNGADLGTAKLLPPCFTVQRFFKTSGSLEPYLGFGLNYTIFSYDLSATLRSLGVSDIDLDNSLGFVVNGGIDVPFKNKWLINFDVKYVDITTEGNVKLAAGGSLDEKVSVNINPWIIGLGVGYKF